MNKSKVKLVPEYKAFQVIKLPTMAGATLCEDYAAEPKWSVLHHSVLTSNC